MSASRVRASALRNSALIFENASLPLSVLSRHISWMTPAGPRMARERLPLDGSRGIAPRPRWRLRPLIEIGEEKSLRREPSAGRSKGGVVNERGGGGRGQSLRVGIDVGKEFHWAHVLDASGRELRGASYFPESSKMMNQTSPTS